MKKLLLLSTVLAAQSFFSQTTKLAIYNYSNYKLIPRFGAHGPSSCYPAVLANVDPALGIITIPPGSPSVPFITEYTYSTSNMSSVPIMTWFVRTSVANPGIDRAYNHPAVSPNSGVSTGSNWSFFIFQARDNANNAYGDFWMGTGSCSGNLNTYYANAYAEAEWFTITSGTNGYTIVQVF